MRLRELLAVIVLASVVAVAGLAPPGAARPDEPATPTPVPRIQDPGLALFICTAFLFDYVTRLGPPANSDLGDFGAERVAPDLRYSSTGRVVSEADRAKGLDLDRVELSTSSAGIRFNFFINDMPPQLPGSSLNILIDDPTRTGGTTGGMYFGGYEVDFGIQVRWEGAGRWTPLGGPLDTLRPITATVSEAPGQVSVSLPPGTVTQFGLDRPGVQFFVGSVGPPPERVYDRLPERGAFALGIAGSDAIPSSTYDRWTVSRFTVGRSALLYLDTDGDRRIDSVGYDRNGDNTMRHRQMEGPARWTLRPTLNYQWEPVERRVNGRAQTFSMRGAFAFYGTRKEDRNNDGSFDGPGEHIGWFYMLRRAFQETYE